VTEKRSTAKRKQRRATPLSKQRRDKKTLDAPFSGLTIPVQFVDWHKERLPEFLWIHYVLSNHGIAMFHGIMDYLDGYADPQQDILLGTISSFELIPPGNRDALIKNMPDTFKSVVAEWTSIAKLYPNMPGSWLFSSEDLPEEPKTLEESLAALKSMVREIFDGKDSPATMTRAAALARLVKHRKIRIPSGEMVDLLAGYPQADDEERKGAESVIRALLGALLATRTEMGEWASYFWRQNYNISVCDKPEPLAVQTSEDAREFIDFFLKATREFANTQRTKLEQACQEIPVDLYEPTRQEVLLGIIGRQFRLLCAILTDPHLWTGDLASHLLRGLFEGLLTMKYLEANPSLYPKFAEYGLGQLKLYKLHLQQIEASQESADPDLTAYLDQLEAVIDSEEWEERLPIHLGSWSGKSERDMATEVGMETEYRLLYQPYSMDVHGTWASLFRWNMVRCRNPLHMFHHLPRFDRPAVINVEVLQAGLDLFEETLSDWADAMSVPMPKSELLDQVHALRRERGLR